MGLPGVVPWPLLLVPIVLLVADVTFKSILFEEPPYDTAADVSIAGLTFTGVHLTAHSNPISKVVFVILFGQFLVWLACGAWGKRLKRRAEEEKKARVEFTRFGGRIGT